MKLDYFGRKIKVGDILKCNNEPYNLVIAQYDPCEKIWYYEDIYDQDTFNDEWIDIDEFIIIGNINNKKDKCIKEKYIQDIENSWGDWKGI